MNYTYQDVLDAVFYAQQKPEALAAIVCKALGVTVPVTPVFRTPVTEKTTESSSPTPEPGPPSPSTPSGGSHT